MFGRKINEIQKEILKIFVEPSVQKEKKGSLTRHEISRRFFQRPKAVSAMKKIAEGRSWKPEKAEEKAADGEKLLKSEAEKRKEWTKRMQQREILMGDWKTRVGARSGTRRIYTKGYDILRQNLKDLVKRDYLKTEGPPTGANYQPTEKGFKTLSKISPRGK